MKNHFFTFGLISFFCLAFLDCFSVPPPVQRPASNTGKGFFVRNGKLYDANGNLFIIRGINISLAWTEINDATVINNYNALDSPNGVVTSNANAVRVICGWSDFNINPNTVSTPAKMRLVVEKLIAQKIVPILEIHYDLKDPNKRLNVDYLNRMVDYWLNPDNIAWMRQYEDKIIINIANEWGHNDEDWKNAYIAAIAKFRKKCINCLLMIDAGGNYAQNPNSLIQYAQNILDSDTQKNVLFSLHMYAFWVNSQSRFFPTRGTWLSADNECGCSGCICPPWDIDVQLTKLRELNIPIVVAEFSSTCSQDVAYETKQLLKTLKNKGIGYLAWSLNNNQDRRFDMLRTGWNSAISLDEYYWQCDDLTKTTTFGELIFKDLALNARKSSVLSNPPITVSPCP